MTRKSYSDRAHQYCRDVVDGKILASNWIKLACARHLDDLKKPGFRWKYDPVRADRVCAWMEHHPHEKGAKQGQPFLLEDWQVWIVCSIFGWVDEAGLRKYREALLLVPRGQGKSPLAALIAIWMVFLDGEKGAEGLIAATTEKQAKECFGPAQHFIREVPAYKAMGITAAAKSIFSTRTRAKLHAIIGKAKYGSAPYVCVMDEAWQLQDSQQYDNFRTGLAKRKNSLLLTVTTAGVSSTENPAYQLQLDCQKILEGSIENDRIFAAIYCADPEVDWTSLEALQMACPNLGISIDTEALLLDQKEAVRNPARQNAFKAMHLNQWSTAKSSWLNMASFDACFDPGLTIESVKDLPCFIGFDLAAKLDLAAAVKVFTREIDGKKHYYALCRAYLPEARVNLPENAHYKKWVTQGWLTSTPGSEIDFETIEQDALEDIEQYKVEAIRPDDKYAIDLMQRLEKATGVTRIDSIAPAEFSEPMKELEAAIVTGRFHHDGNPILKWCLSNVTTYIRRDQAYAMPDKERPESKIDVAIALLIAMSRAMLAPAEPQETWTAEVW